MALVPTVTKKSVSETMDNAWTVTLHLSVMDGADEVISQDFSILYKSIHDAEVIVKKLKVAIQEAITDYKQEQTLFNHAKLDKAVTWINNNLTV